MSEQLKFIVDSLNKPPFSRTYNLIRVNERLKLYRDRDNENFDSLQPLQLLQVLNDVFTEVSPQQASDLREEDPEQRVVRMFGFLRMLKYKPKTEAGNLSAFRQGLVQGDKPVVYPILQWTLERLDELKKRAYVARYLMKVEVPPEILMDNEVSETNHMYLELIEQFKECHKQSEQLKGSGFSASEIKKDIFAMEEEKEQLRKRIERMQKRVDGVSGKDRLLLSARELRTEREKEASLHQQKIEQRNQVSRDHLQNQLQSRESLWAQMFRCRGNLLTLNHAEQKLQRLTMQLQDLRSAGMGITADALVKRLEEENQVNTYLCHDKLPKEIEGKRKYAQNLEKVANEPAMGQSELDQLNKKIKELSAEINGLVEKRMVRNEPMDDKLSVFRQQAAVIANKKNAAAEKMQEVTDDLHSAEEELQEKRSQLKETDGVEILKGDDFKRYVNKLRGKSTVYKKKRAELAELRAEYGVLSRTEEILKGRDQQTQAFLAQLEAKHGVSGFHETQEELEKVSTMKSDFDDAKGKTLEDMSQLVVQLTNTIAERKTALAPIIKELRPLRQQCQELTSIHEEKKSAYETTAAGLESNMSKLEQEVKAYREETTHEESRYHYIQAMIKILEGQQKRIEDELKLYVSSDPTERKKSLRDQFSQKIHEQENLGKALREKQKSVKENQGPNMKQMKMWKDLMKMMQCKKDLMEGRKPAGQQVQGLSGFEEEDRLIL